MKKKKKKAELLPAHISKNALSVEKKARVNKIKKRIVNGKFVLSRRCQILQIESSLIETRLGQFEALKTLAPVLPQNEEGL